MAAMPYIGKEIIYGYALLTLTRLDGVTTTTLSISGVAVTVDTSHDQCTQCTCITV